MTQSEAFDLQAQLKSIRKSHDKLRADRVAHMAFEVFKRKLWLGGLVIIALAALGVPTSTTLFLAGQMDEVHAARAAAAVGTDELAKSIKRAQEQYVEVSQATDRARDSLNEVNRAREAAQLELSELRGTIERESSALGLRLESLDRRLKVVTDVAEKGVRGKVQDIEQQQVKTQQAFASRNALSVRIVHALRSEARAKEFQKTLAGRGYATSRVSTDFKELPSVSGSGVVQVVALQEELSNARDVAVAIGEPQAAAYSPKIAKGTVQVWVF